MRSYERSGAELARGHVGRARDLDLAEWLHLAMWLLLAPLARLRILASLQSWPGAILPRAGVRALYRRKLDLGTINRAFFYSNAFVGIVFFATTLAAVLDPAWK